MLRFFYVKNANQQHTLLTVNDLHIKFPQQNAVKGISFAIERGSVLGLVGESGSGKSVTALSILGLLGPSAKVSGTISLDDVSLLGESKRVQRSIRGSQIGLVFQEPGTALNPVLRCGVQIGEVLALHKGLRGKALRAAVLTTLERVQLDDAERVYNAYPHTLSGGQKQRVLIAMAICCNPAFLIADEPTTALDVTVQKSILDLLKDLQKDLNMGMLFISHDIGVISYMADRIAVMKAGQIVETGTKMQILNAPQHTYTQSLLKSRPSLHRRINRLPTLVELDEHTWKEQEVTEAMLLAAQQKIYAQPPIVDTAPIEVTYPIRYNWFRQATAWKQAVIDVPVRIHRGEIVGLVGESGSGKSSLAKALAQSIPNSIMVFQDPYSSLNPSMTVFQAVSEPFTVQNPSIAKAEIRTKVLQLLDAVGLQAHQLERYPAELSGGQRQRVCIARALAAQPTLLICDEIVSALDMSIQATILNLIEDLRDQFELSFLFVTHDLSLVRQICDRVMVLHQGVLVEEGLVQEVLDQPTDRYTQALVQAATFF